jgi:hypothetical protein
VLRGKQRGGAAVVGVQRCQAAQRERERESYIIWEAHFAN